MANNRVYICCTVCEDSLSLMKFYPSSGWALSRDEGTLDRFFSDHTTCWENEDPVYGDTWVFETTISTMEHIDGKPS